MKSLFLLFLLFSLCGQVNESLQLLPFDFSLLLSLQTLDVINNGSRRDVRRVWFPNAFALFGFKVFLPGSIEFGSARVVPMNRDYAPLLINLHDSANEKQRLLASVEQRHNRADGRFAVGNIWSASSWLRRSTCRCSLRSFLCCHSDTADPKPVEKAFSETQDG